MKRILALAVALVIGISGFALAGEGATPSSTTGKIASAPAKPAPQAKKAMHKKGHGKAVKATAPAGTVAPASPAGK